MIVMLPAGFAELILTVGCVVLGAMIFWRALVNANNMDKRTRHGIRALNMALFAAGVLMIMSPLASIEAMCLSLQAAVAVFVICMLIGRRPTDRVLSQQ